MKIKICGITRREDMRLAAREGADYFGTVVEIDRSPRRLDRAAAAAIHRDAPIPGAALVQDRSADDILAIAALVQPFAMQLQGRETPELVRLIRPKLCCEIWKALHVPVKGGQAADPDALLREARAFLDAGVDKFLVDTIDVSGGFARMGGTGKVGDWAAAAKVVEQLDALVFLAGGINPDNAASAIRQVHPFGIDLASGVESAPGIKDPAKVRRLIANARGEEGLRLEA
jgi:phosphoribosylanthranilate isomerase